MGRREDVVAAQGTRLPGYFAQVRPIVVRDGLAQFLGAVADGRLEYTYLDAVKLTGHSCPTVAGAFAATREALARLYPDELPERGAVAVELRGSADEGTVGVVASVAGLVTGAAGQGGFKGVAGRFRRRGLLCFDASIPADLRFTRLDTGASVDIDLPQASSMAPELREAMQRALSPDASAAEREQFGRGWQARTAALLFP